MRRILLAALVGIAAVPVLTGPAQAKGENIHARVVIEGPGLAAPLVLAGEDAGLYVARSGAEQAKWDAPNIGGTLEPGADLGPAFTAVVRIRCGRTALTPYRQTLYPQAPQGLQVYTPLGAVSCFGQPSPGYWPAATELLDLLAHRGLPVHATEGAGSRSGQVGVAGADAGSGGSGGSGLAAVALVVVVGLLAIGVALDRSRRRGDGKPVTG